MKIAIVMGSASDWPVMQAAKTLLLDFGVEVDCHILSAHRVPREMLSFAEDAESMGYAVIIAGAGGAAHLPGMLASASVLPVIGVPIKSSNSIDGWDSLLSIVQMPDGVPVATVALNGAYNAAILALQILALKDLELNKKLKTFKQSLQDKVKKQRQDTKF